MSRLDDLRDLAAAEHGDDICTEWPYGRTDRGYGNLKMPDGRYLGAHRAAWEEMRGPIPQGMVVRHLCHNRACVRISHLALGTYLDNRQDMINANRDIRGSMRKTSRLTEQQVIALRGERAAGATMYSLAKQYGVNVATIHSIIHRKTWKHV